MYLFLSKRTNEREQAMYLEVNEKHDWADFLLSDWEKEKNVAFIHSFIETKSNTYSFYSIIKVST